MENSDIKKTKETIKRIMKYIFHISPKYFYLNIIFTILVGFTSAMSIWSTKLLINGIVNVNTHNNFIKILITYGVINIFIQIIQSLNSYINSKHQLKIDYKMSMDILEKCGELRLQDFEDSEIYNILGRAEMEGQTKVYISYRNILSIITQIALINLFAFHQIHYLQNLELGLTLLLLVLFYCLKSYYSYGASYSK